MAGCSNVNSIDSMPLSKIYSYKICAKREGEPFYLAQRPIKKFGQVQCPNGYKICGSGGDDMASCARESERCPINDFYFINGDDKVPDGYSSSKLDDGYSLVFSSNSSHLPFVKIQLEQGDVCSDPKEHDWPRDRSKYVLLNAGYMGG